MFCRYSSSAEVEIISRISSPLFQWWGVLVNVSSETGRGGGHINLVADLSPHKVITLCQILMNIKAKLTDRSMYSAQSSLLWESPSVHYNKMRVLNTTEPNLVVVNFFTLVERRLINEVEPSGEFVLFYMTYAKVKAFRLAVRCQFIHQL